MVVLVVAVAAVVLVLVLAVVLVVVAAAVTAAGGEGDCTGCVISLAVAAVMVAAAVVAGARLVFTPMSSFPPSAWNTYLSFAYTPSNVAPGSSGLMPSPKPCCRSISSTCSCCSGVSFDARWRLRS